MTPRCCYCDHFGLDNEHFICHALNIIIPLEETETERVCYTYLEDLPFKTKKDVYDFFWDDMCSGCEYAEYDRDGHAYPGMEDGSNCVCGDQDSINAALEDIEKLPLEIVIQTHTPTNNRMHWPMFYDLKLKIKRERRKSNDP